MFLTKKATSIIEAMVVLLIVTMGVLGMYKVFNESQQLSNSTGNRIQAIQIAREGIEGVKNIRDTNWILFSSDIPNCWNVFNYNTNCVGENSITNDISSGSYLIYQDNYDRWILDKKDTDKTKFSEVDYRDEMKVGLDAKGFFTQSGAVSEIITLFTREIKINYTSGSDDPKMEVISVVKWKDNGSTNPHKVEFKAVLTNWEK